ncbi:MAG: cupin domain-containing protein [Bacteroidota bacterium]
MHQLIFAEQNKHLLDAESDLVNQCKHWYNQAQSKETIAMDKLVNENYFIQISYLSGIRNKGVTFEENESLLKQIWNFILQERIEGLLKNVNDKNSLTPKQDSTFFETNALAKFTEELYSNVNDKLNIDFQVKQIPYPLDVLDPRIVKIAPHKNNELHKHAHETVFVFFQGEGTVCVDDHTINVRPGSIVFIPRWSMHQSQNHSNETMIFLAVADFGFTGKTFVGNYLKTARLKEVNQK